MKFKSHPLVSLISALALVWSVGCKSAGDSESKSTNDGSTGKGIVCKDKPASIPNLPSYLKPGVTCAQLVEKFPNTERPESSDDKKIICPFLRLLKRTGLSDKEIEANLKTEAGKGAVAPVTLAHLKAVTDEIGCEGSACVAVAQSVAKNQNTFTPPQVDIGKLFAAPPRSTYNDTSKDRASHDCGYTFQFGDETVNEQVRITTMKRFKELADKNSGKITVEDLVTVKKEACRRDYKIYKTKGINPFNKVDDAKQTLVPDSRDETEVALIFAYLGGVDNGYISYESLDNFFHAKLAPTKTSFLLDFPLLGLGTEAHKKFW